MENVYITKLGVKSTNVGWKENQMISCHENLAKKFIEKGFAVKAKGEVIKDVPKVIDAPKVVKKAKK